MKCTSLRFTLVELMIVIAIVAVLAAIAIPSLAELDRRAKLAEAEPNVRDLTDAAWLFANTVDLGNESGGPWPRDRTTTDKTQAAWAGAPAGFEHVGWEPDGDVRCGYSFSANTLLVMGALKAPGASAAVVCDVDDDNRTWEMATWQYGEAYSPYGGTYVGGTLKTVHKCWSTSGTSLGDCF